MKKPAILFALVALSLSACGGVRNLQSVKSSDYDTTPKNIVAVLQDADPTFPAFKARLTEEMASCGIKLQFATVLPGQTNINAPGADAFLLFKELAHETTTRRQNYQVTDQYVSMYRYEVTLTDIATKKTVWKGVGDFRTLENAKSNYLGKLVEASPAMTWSRDLMDQMKKDGLVGNCDSAAAKTAAADAPVAATPAAATPGGTGNGGDIPLPAAAPQTMRYNVNGTIYDSLEAAEAAMRTDAAKEVAQINPVSGPHRAALVIVAPTQQQTRNGSIVPPNMSATQLDQIWAYMAVVNKVGYDANLDAIRKAGLFDQVTLIRADDVGEDDFRGATYKLSLAQKDWVLTKQGGGKQKVSALPVSNVKVLVLTKMLDNLQAAATTLDAP